MINKVKCVVGIKYSELEGDKILFVVVKGYGDLVEVIIVSV